jgi:hypothetical protein
MSTEVCDESKKKIKCGGSSVGYNDVMLAIQWMVGVFYKNRYYEPLGKFWAMTNPEGSPLSDLLSDAGDFVVDGNLDLLSACEPGMRLLRLIYACDGFYFKQKARPGAGNMHMFVDFGEQGHDPEKMPFVVPLPGQTMLNAAVLVDLCVRIRDNKKTAHQELFSILFEKTISFGFVGLRWDYYEAWRKKSTEERSSPGSSLEDFVYKQYSKDTAYYSIPHCLLDLVQKEAGFRYLDLIKMYEALVEQESWCGKRWCAEGQLKDGGEMKWKDGSHAQFMMWAIEEELFGVPNTKWGGFGEIPPGRCMDKQGIEEMFDAYSDDDTEQMQKTVRFLRRCAKSHVDGKSHFSSTILVDRLRKLMLYLGNSVSSPSKDESSRKRQRTD